MATIEIKNMIKKYGDLTAVNNLNLTIHDKEFLVLLGPSGCGKTTTLRSIAGLENIDEGEIWIDGLRVDGIRGSDRDIAFVFQLYALYPHLTVYSNMSFPLRAQGMNKGEIKARVSDAAKLLKIEHIMDKKPRALSGGDMQRVAIGRAIVRRPKAFLMDEPIGTLDTHFREQMRTELRRLHIDIGATTVYVTHDQTEAMSMSDKIAIMDKAVLQQVGTPMEVYNNPINLFVANFIGSPGMNFLKCKYYRENGKVGIKLDSSKEIIEFPKEKIGKLFKEDKLSSDLMLGIRFEDISVTSKKRNGDLQGEVYVFEKVGPYNIIDIELAGDILKAKSAAMFKPEIGSKLWFKFNMDRAHLFDVKTGNAITNSK